MPELRTNDKDNTRKAVIGNKLQSQGVVEAELTSREGQNIDSRSNLHLFLFEEDAKVSAVEAWTALSNSKILYIH